MAIDEMTEGVAAMAAGATDSEIVLCYSGTPGSV